MLLCCYPCLLLGFPYIKASVGVCRDVPDHGLYPSAVSASRHFHVSPARGAEISVVVPSMGDSISEGSVASLEKKPGVYLSSGIVLCPGPRTCNRLFVMQYIDTAEWRSAAALQGFVMSYKSCAFWSAL